MSPDSVKTNYSVPNLQRAFIIMELLGQSRKGLTLTELANSTDYPQNSIFRICKTLEELGYTKRQANSKRYQLSNKILNLALGAASPGGSLLEVSIPVLQRLAYETGETSCLGTIVGNKGVVLAVEPGSSAFRFHIDLGTSFNLHTAAPAKAMLAMMPAERAQEIVSKMEFPQYTETTITSAEDFNKHLQLVAQQGFGVDQAEEMPGQHCLAAAIRMPYGETSAAIWITAPASRLPIADFPKIGKQLQALCREIEESLETA